MSARRSYKREVEIAGAIRAEKDWRHASGYLVEDMLPKAWCEHVPFRGKNHDLCVLFVHAYGCVCKER